MKTSKDFIVSKSNTLINSNYDLNLNEQKIVLVLAANIKPEDKDFTTHEISITDLAKILDVSSQNLYRDIPKITKSLMSKILEFTKINEKGQKVLIQTAFLSTAIYNNTTGMVTLKFSDHLKDYLLELKTLFTSYRLANALCLNSKYSIRVYEKCRQEAFKGGFVWTVDDIKKQLGLTQKTYQQFAKIKEKILTPTFQEINQNTDIAVSYESVKEGRKIVAIKVTIKENKTLKSQEINSINGVGNYTSNNSKRFKKAKGSNTSSDKLIIDGQEVDDSAFFEWINNKDS